MKLGIGQESLDIVNGKGFVELSSITGRFARVKTDPSTDARKRVFLFDQVPGFTIFPFSGQDHEAFDIGSSRTGLVAGRGLHHISRSEVPPGPCLIPVHRPQGYGDGRNLMKMFESDLLFHRSSVPTTVSIFECPPLELLIKD
jgi:hypothetical protein